MRHPRDRSMGHFVQVVNCRCTLMIDPLGIAKRIKAERAVVIGTKVKASIKAKGPRIIEAEYGEIYADGIYADGAWFMRRMVRSMGVLGKMRRVAAAAR